MLTIAYCTNRLNPQIEWFFRSLEREIGNDRANIEIVVVDFWMQDMEGWTPYNVTQRKLTFANMTRLPFIHIPPKPTVWQGPHRLTKRDYFAAANARNTALCCARDGWIVYVDDLSILRIGWLKRVRMATERGDIITLGNFQKVSDLKMNPAGTIASFKQTEQGEDHREKRIRLSGKDLPDVMPCGSGWFYGCCIVSPVTAFLKINGWDERCDGMGYEDIVTGIALEMSGAKFCFDRKMGLLESEDMARAEKNSMVRSDPGVSPKDKSHRILELVRAEAGWSPNDFGNGRDLKYLREETLIGAKFPVPTKPEVEWFTGTPLKYL